MRMGCGTDDNKSLLVVVVLVLVLVLVVGGGESGTGTGTGTGTRVGFYSESCSRAESIIRSTVEAHVAWEPSVAAALLRLHFHDCFVRGCDASILIEGPHAELASGANKDLKGAVEVIEEAKKYVEGTCPGVVSCADILALAARDSVVLSGGLTWDVPTGRRDGRVSKESEPSLNLAGPNEPVSVLKRKFARKGLNSKDLVALVGAHTIGTAGCTPVIARLGGVNGTEETDPSINPKFLSQLRKLCPQNETNRRVALDLNSQFKFDTSYFANLKNGLGILRSDQALWTDASTRPFVQSYLATDVFNLEFAKSMVKMSNIGVNTGSQGEIRRICSAIN